MWFSLFKTQKQEIENNSKSLCGRSVTIVIAGSNAMADQKLWADGVCSGSSSNYTDEKLIQRLIDDAVSKGYESITLIAFGTFWIGNPIRIPYKVNFFVNGEGIPNIEFNISNATVTPTAGTQFRSTPSWNTSPWCGTCDTDGLTVIKRSGNYIFDVNWVSQPFYINNNSYIVASVNATGNTLTLTEDAGIQTNVRCWYSPSIFVRVKPEPAGGVINAIGQTRFENLALMPAWGTVSNSVAVYGLTDLYGANLRLDNFMFLPYGWLEEGQPQVDYANNPFMALNCQGGNYGGGSDCNIGSLYIFAHGGSGPVWESIIGYDCVKISKLMMFGCFRGILFQSAWLNEIDELIVYGSTGLAVAFNTSYGRGNTIHRLNYESLNKGRMYENPLVYLYKNAYIEINYFYNWPSYFSSDITAISNDDSRLEKSCLAFNMGNSGIIQSVPQSVMIETPFGGQIPFPFLDGTYPTAGAEVGKLNCPSSGVRYYVGTPIDITITGGTDVHITTVDAQGNIIDKDVSSLSHRLLIGSMCCTNTYLLTGDSIKVTYSSAPTVSVLQATVGLSGSSPLPAPGVNYIADKIGVDVSFSGGESVSASVSANSKAAGPVLDADLTSMVGYHIAPGQVINFGSYSKAPERLVVRRHSEI